MSQFSKYDPFSSDRFFKDHKSNPIDAPTRIIKPSSSTTALFPLNESEEFHDPFSEMNLFLAKRIKREILREKNPKKWSRKIQSLLLKEILPDFSKRFPGYRLGSSALQKTWNKVLYYLQTIQQKKGALKPNGKLNVEYLIKENLKNLESTSSDFHPYNTAHSLAVKISECIAAIDGDKPELENLTKTIWAVQKHLIESSQKIPKAPFDSIDSLDKLIVRFQLEELALDETLHRQELALRVKKRLLHAKNLNKIRNLDELFPKIMTLVAEHLYPHLNIHKILSKEHFEQMTLFIQAQIKKTTACSNIEKEQFLTLIASRICFLYKLASQMSLAEAEENLEAAIQYVYSLSTDSFQANTPVLREEVYHFIHQEISFLKQERVADPLKQLLQSLIELFAKAKNLPKLPIDLFEDLEVVIWKIIAEETTCMSKLPGYLRRVIYDEVAMQHIDHQSLPFKKIVQKALFSLKSLRNLELNQLDAKLEIWSHQNTMVASHLYFENEDSLLICMEAEFQKTPRGKKELLIDHAMKAYLKTHPVVSGWKQSLKIRFSIVFQYLWYQKHKQAGESSFDRHILYHYNQMTTQQEKQFPELLIPQLEMSFHETLPLFPFRYDHCRMLIESV